MIADIHGRGLTDLRISLTDRCNLRCTYCMPKEVFGPDYPFLKKEAWLRFTELDDLVEAFVQLGVRKIRLTGGEPLLRLGINKFIQGLSRFQQIEDIALTTNGLRLAERAAELKAAGLKRVTVSLDALDPMICGRINGLGIGPKVVLAGIEAAQEVGLGVKVNAVIERNINESEILPLARYCKAQHINLRFIEFMDVGNHNQWDMSKVVSGKEILATLRTEFELLPIDLSSSLQVAKRYRHPGGSEIGLITSVSEPFCSGCTRARISADGLLYTCLFANKGLDLKAYLRSPGYQKEALFNLLAKHWKMRSDRYSEERTRATAHKPKVEMSYIGG